MNKTVYNTNKVYEHEQNTVRDEGVLICDSGAGFSVFKDLSLFPLGVWDSDSFTLVSGVQRGGEPIKVTREGITPFGIVGYSEDVDINILSLADVNDNCSDWYGKGDSLYVRTDNDTCRFKKGYDRVYIWSKEDGIIRKPEYNTKGSTPKAMVVSIVTVETQKKLYTNQQIKDADRARKLQANMGYINEHKIIDMIRSNQIGNCDVTETDIRNSVHIYGRSIDYLKGNSNSRSGDSVKYEGISSIPNNVQRSQLVSMDIMMIGKQLSLVTVTTPLEMTFIKEINNKSEEELGNAVLNQIEQINKKGFIVEKVIWDSESAIRSEGLSSKIRAKVKDLEIFEPERHVARVERRIQRIKKMFRAIKTGAVYDWDSSMDNYCVNYCINRINHIPMENSSSNMSPWTKMTGKRADTKYDYRHEFGEYVQYIENDTTNSTSVSRTHGALALFPAGSNMWYYKRLSDGKVIKRSRAVSISISQEIITYINEKARVNRSSKVPLFILGDKTDVNEWDIEDNGDCDIPALPNQEMTQGNADNEEQYHSDVAQDIEVDDDPAIRQQLLVEEIARGQQSVARENLIEEDVLNEEISFVSERDREKPQYLAMILREKYKREKLESPSVKLGLANMTVKEALISQGEAALKEIVREMSNIHIDRKGFKPIKYNELTVDQQKRIISSKLFLENKYYADGEFEKIKAHLVAGGHLQDRNIYTNGGSPTASRSSVLTIATLAAKENRAVGTVDFPSAFLNCEMPEDAEPVYMRLDVFSTMVMIEIDANFLPFVSKDGTSIVVLKRALYGCVESSRIWNDKLHSELTVMGYVRNEYDKCIYNRIEKDLSQTTLVVHVDDIFISAKNEENIDYCMNEIEKVFGQVTKHRGRVLNYVGMTFTFDEASKLKVTMKGYIQDLMKFVASKEEYSGTAPGPARESLFDTKYGNCDLLNKEEKEHFHTLTAKLLYLSKRVRPDILVAVSYLCKRVQIPTDGDKNSSESFSMFEALQILA